MHLEDLPKRRVDHVIAVDTQTVQPVRGMSQATTGHVIDHHPLVRELASGWSFWGEEVCTTTTLLVERIADQGVAVSSIEATLLLWASTRTRDRCPTPAPHTRDLRAVLWLWRTAAAWTWSTSSCAIR